MKSFSVFNDELRQAYKKKNICENGLIVNITSASNIEKEIRNLISIEELRDNGSFFTSDKIAEKANQALPKKIQNTSIICDPTCGTGNLLINASKSFPVFQSLEDTLDIWGESLRGFDVIPEFVECTKLRLILEAINRGAKSKHSSLEALEERFKYIITGSVFDHLNSLAPATHLFINPPYVSQNAYNDCKWASGKVNAAAVFMERILENINPEASFTAILPEVLRSGSRYYKWRSLVTSMSKTKSTIIGRFNDKTDVDVFILSGEKSSDRCSPVSSWVTQVGGVSVGNKFDVSIGPLVSYRDKEFGSSVPYIYSKMLKAWDTIEKVETVRKTKSRLISPPFIAIKRTSSPRDRNRAAGTLILGTSPVAVENHLIILKPKRGGKDLCIKLLNLLQSNETNRFLNQRIRCRHLTVGSIKEIPWTDK